MNRLSQRNGYVFLEAEEKRSPIALPRLSLSLERLVEPVSRGDPQSPLRWTTASKQQLAQALQQRGYEIGASTVGDLLREALGYSLQSNKKRYEGKQHADRDQQFAQINKQAAEARAHGHPVLSVDTKKKELVGHAQKQRERMEAQRNA